MNPPAFTTASETRSGMSEMFTVCGAFTSPVTSTRLPRKAATRTATWGSLMAWRSRRVSSCCTSMTVFPATFR